MVPLIQPTTKDSTIEKDATGTHNEVGDSRGQGEAKSSPVSSEPRTLEPEAPRRSTKTRKPVDWFTPDKAHGYHVVTNYLDMSINNMCKNISNRKIHDVNLLTALAMDPYNGYIDSTIPLSMDFLTGNPGMFKATSTKDLDSPNIKDAMSGPYRDEFVAGMSAEIEELQAHGTWTVMKRDEIPEQLLPDGTMGILKVVPTTWVFRIK